MELGSLMGAVMGEKILCPKCGQGFNQGDVLEFIVTNVVEDGTILKADPLHKICPAITTEVNIFNVFERAARPVNY